MGITVTLPVRDQSRRTLFSIATVFGHMGALNNRMLTCFLTSRWDMTQYVEEEACGKEVEVF